MIDLQIIDEKLILVVHGFSGIAANKDYAGTAFRLMDRMRKTVRAQELKTKGLNIWIYEPGEKVFAGVELEGSPKSDSGLEQKSIVLTKYAYYKRGGPGGRGGRAG